MGFGSVPTVMTCLLYVTPRCAVNVCGRHHPSINALRVVQTECFAEARRLQPAEELAKEKERARIAADKELQLKQAAANA